MLRPQKCGFTVAYFNFRTLTGFSNEEVLRGVGMEKQLLQTMEQRQLKFLGHDIHKEVSVLQGNMKANSLKAGGENSSSRTLNSALPGLCGTEPATLQNGKKWFVKHQTGDCT